MYQLHVISYLTQMCAAIKQLLSLKLRQILLFVDMWALTAPELASVNVVCILDVTDLYHALGNPQGEAESYRMHDSFSQMLLKDHFQSTQLSEHRLIQVTLSCCWCLCEAAKLVMFGTITFTTGSYQIV